MARSAGQARLIRGVKRSAGYGRARREIGRVPAIIHPDLAAGRRPLHLRHFHARDFPVAAAENRQALPWGNKTAVPIGASTAHYAHRSALLPIAITGQHGSTTPFLNTIPSLNQRRRDTAPVVV
jgi:hypothetical protein